MRVGILILLMVVAASCENNDAKQLTTNWNASQIEQKRDKVKEVMAIHDEAMPWMEDTRELSKQLKKLQTDSISDSMRTLISSSLVELEEADEAMMGWMRSYKEPADNGSVDMAISYLESERIKVEEVRAIMSSAINNAKQLVSNE